MCQIAITYSVSKKKLKVSLHQWKIKVFYPSAALYPKSSRNVFPFPHHCSGIFPYLTIDVVAIIGNLFIEHLVFPVIHMAQALSGAYPGFSFEGGLSGHFCFGGLETP